MYGVRIVWEKDSTMIYPSERATISDRLLDLIKTCEGFRCNAYNDAAGLPTIGYGHLISQAESCLKKTTLTERESHTLLRADITTRADIKPYVLRSLASHQSDALTSLCFNIGMKRFSQSMVLKHTNTQDYESACAFFGHWRRSGGVALPGLMMRRLAEACIFSHRLVDPASSFPPSVQWGRPPIPITDENWTLMGKDLRVHAVAIYEAYWAE